MIHQRRMHQAGCTTSTKIKQCPPRVGINKGISHRHSGQLANVEVGGGNTAKYKPRVCITHQAGLDISYQAAQGMWLLRFPDVRRLARRCTFIGGPFSALPSFSSLRPFSSVSLSAVPQDLESVETPFELLCCCFVQTSIAHTPKFPVALLRS
ncbi:hypothetical protein V8C44DRAFT_131179 [Trichoderma aethiopicum]